MAASGGVVVVIFCALFLVIQAGNLIDEKEIDYLKYVDESVDPCEDFYEFSCGNYGKYHEIPDLKDHYDNFELLGEKLLSISQDILARKIQADDPVAVKKAKTAYKACILETNVFYYDYPELEIIDTSGGFPMLQKPGEVPREFSWKEIGELVGKFGVQLFFQVSNVQLSKNMASIMLSQAPADKIDLIRPIFESMNVILETSFRKSVKDIPTVISRDPRELQGCESGFSSPLEELWLKILQRLTQKLGINRDLRQEIRDVVIFSQELYNIEETRKMNLSNIGSLQNSTVSRNINWLDFLGGIFSLAGVNVTNTAPSIFYEANYVSQVLDLVNRTDTRILRNFVWLKILFFMSPDSDEETREFFEKYYLETHQQTLERTNYCTRRILDVVDSVGLSFAIAHDFQKYHVNTNRLKEAAKMTDDLKTIYEASFQLSDWLSAASSANATEKMENIKLMLAYPDFVADSQALDEFYENVRICQWDHYGNSQRIHGFRQAYKNSILALADSSNHWTYSPMVTNAFYNKQNNRFFLPVAILDEIFHPGNPLFLARLGFITAHEMSHGFDKDGYKYDKDGNQIAIFDDETETRFVDRSDCLVAEYNQFSLPEYNYTVDGDKTVSENFADHSGISQSFKLFENLLNSGEIQVSLRNKFTAQQLFFISHATMFCELVSQNWIDYLSTTGYPPNKFRVLGNLRNSDSFADAFQCPVGSFMNPEISEKCRFW